MFSVHRWRVDQVLCSEWISMDPRLLELNPAEQAALAFAQDQKKKNIDVQVKPLQPKNKKKGNADSYIVKKIYKTLILTH